MFPPAKASVFLAGVDSTNLFILSYIGQGDGFFDAPGFTASMVYQALEANPTAKEINVIINSGGGDVREGEAIYNALVGSGKIVNVKIAGLCASIASIVAMAASPGKLTATRNAELMIHPAWTYAEGNSQQLIEVARELAAIDERLFSYYINRRSGKLTIPVDELRGYFNSETFFTADKALSIGLIDGIDAEVVPASNLSYNKHRAYAFLTPKPTEMKLSPDDKSWFEGFFNKLKAIITPIKNMSAQLADGTTTVYFAGDALTDGMEVFSDVAMTIDLADGSYSLDDGTSFTITGGMAGSVQANAEGPTNQQLTALQAQLDALKAENDTLKATAQAAEQGKAEALTQAATTKTQVLALSEEFKTFQAKFQSDDEAPGKVIPVKVVTKPEEQTAEQRAVAYFEKLKTVKSLN